MKQYLRHIVFDWPLDAAPNSVFWQHFSSTHSHPTINDWHQLNTAANAHFIICMNASSVAWTINNRISANRQNRHRNQSKAKRKVNSTQRTFANFHTQDNRLNTSGVSTDRPHDSWTWQSGLSARAHLRSLPFHHYVVHHLSKSKNENENDTKHDSSRIQKKSSHIQYFL